MNAFLMLDFFTTIINTLFRNIPDAVRWILVVVFMAVGMFCLSRSLVKKKEQIKYGYLILAVIFVALSILYITIR